jgi:hypothetical protein
MIRRGGKVGVGTGKVIRGGSHARCTVYHRAIILHAQRDHVHLAHWRATVDTHPEVSDEGPVGIMDLAALSQVQGSPSAMARPAETSAVLHIATPHRCRRYRRERNHERITFRLHLVATANVYMAPHQLMVHCHSRPYGCLIDVPPKRLGYVRLVIDQPLW